MLILKRKILQKSPEARKGQAKANEVLDKLPTGSRIGYTAADTGIMVGVGLTGAFISKVLGRPSFYLGMAATTIGCYINQPLLSCGGLGLMAGGVSQPIDAPSIFGEGGGEVFKIKAKEFGNQVMHHTYFSGLFSGDDEEATTEDATAEEVTDSAVEGFGSVGSAGLTVFDELEAQLERDARATTTSVPFSVVQEPFQRSAEPFDEAELLAQPNLSLL